ncbi:MAG: ATPase, partial [Thermodesulfobacteriota bacterium]
MDALKALTAVDFNWAMHLRSVWRDTDYDVTNLHRAYRTEFGAKLITLIKATDPSSPLGWVIVGSAGAGKTHLLGAMRKTAARTRAGFILVDLTDVHDFWEAVRLGFVGSLQQPYPGARPQYNACLEQLLGRLSKQKYGAEDVKKIARLSRKKLLEIMGTVTAYLAGKFQDETLRFQDAVRALFLLNSNDFAVKDVGFSWLQGLELEEEDRKNFGFKTPRRQALETVEALSWVMSLKGPTLLALDQVDPIVTQAHLAAGVEGAVAPSDEQKTALSIIQGIANGLMALMDKTKRTLTVVACTETTWDILQKRALKSSTDRFEPTRTLSPVSRRETAENLVVSRLAPAYKKEGFAPPYPSWPVTPEVLEKAKGLTPRDILKICDRHRQECRNRGEVFELTEAEGPSREGPPPPDKALARLDRAFEDFRRAAPINGLLDETRDDDLLGPVLQAAGRALVLENPLPEDVDPAVDTDFPGGKSYRPLHVRVRLIYRLENDREEHLCLRAIQKKNALAYQNRLQAALTFSGPDKDLRFRRLFILRTVEIPGGSKSTGLTAKFEEAGGSFLHPSEEELRTLWAVGEMEKEAGPDWVEWLKARRPVSRLLFLRPAAGWLFNPGRPAGGPAEKKTEPSAVSSPAGPVIEAPAPAAPSGPGPLLPFGARLAAGRPAGPAAVPLAELRKHVVVLAGAGAGKTVLLRRLVEEAALLGVPSIVVDGANDLARLGDLWPSPPETWGEGDPGKAEEYHRRAQVVVWTPGREKGLPLHLEPLPDLAGLAGDQDELDQAVDLVREALESVAAPGRSHSAHNKKGLLAAALKYYARFRTGGLEGFIELLSALPAEAGAGISGAGKLARQMADSLRAETQKNLLWRRSGRPLDPALL